MYQNCASTLFDTIYLITLQMWLCSAPYEGLIYKKCT